MMVHKTDAGPLFKLWEKLMPAVYAVDPHDLINDMWAYRYACFLLYLSTSLCVRVCVNSSNIYIFIIQCYLLVSPVWYCAIQYELYTIATHGRYIYYFVLFVLVFNLSFVLLLCLCWSMCFVCVCLVVGLPLLHRFAVDSYVVFFFFRSVF
jgi:hypothetical protein